MPRQRLALSNLSWNWRCRSGMQEGRAQQSTSASLMRKDHHCECHEKRREESSSTTRSWTAVHQYIKLGWKDNMRSLSVIQKVKQGPSTIQTGSDLHFLKAAAFITGCDGILHHLNTPKLDTSQSQPYQHKGACASLDRQELFSSGIIKTHTKAQIGMVHGNQNS